MMLYRVDLQYEIWETTKWQGKAEKQRSWEPEMHKQNAKTEKQIPKWIALKMVMSRAPLRVVSAQRHAMMA